MYKTRKSFETNRKTGYESKKRFKVNYNPQDASDLLKSLFKNLNEPKQKTRLPPLLHSYIDIRNEDNQRVSNKKNGKIVTYAVRTSRGIYR